MFSSNATQVQAGGSAANYVEDVFSTYLYTGNGTSQTINNGIRLGTGYVNGSGTSALFSPTSNYLSSPGSNSAYYINGAGNFTIEFFVYYNALPSGNNNQGATWYAQDSGTAVDSPFNLVQRGNIWYLYASTNSGVWDIFSNQTIATTSLTTGVWYHVALVRNGSTFTLYIDGTARGTATSSGNIRNTSSLNLYLFGSWQQPSQSNGLNGYVSSYRIVKGTAVYTSNFTPPSAPLTAISNTSLLICRETNAFTDYSGNSISITNNGGATQSAIGPVIELGKGGIVWQKSRSDALSHVITDTITGPGLFLESNSAGNQGSNLNSITAFSNNGFSFGSSANLNTNSATYASWTFAKQPKFFDVVTYTGNGVAGRQIPHNLGSVPGCIMVKRLDATSDWQVYHRSLANTQYVVLNSTAAVATGATRWNSTTPTDTVFSVGTDATVNASSQTYIAYIFAHDAGGFGLTGNDNVISCGSFTTSGSGVATVNLGYEPQWLLIKSSSGTSGWDLIDNMRGMPNLGEYGDAAGLEANNSNAEGSRFPNCYPTATGFYYGRAASTTYIYVAIRRGPMKVPTTGTSVFGLNARTGTGANATVTGSAGVSDAVLVKNRGAAVASLFSSRLTGTGYLVTSTTAAEVAAGTTILQANPWDVMDGVKVGTTSTITNASSNTYINYLFDRAPGFFDQVCYSGNSTAGATQTHNLGVVPELMIVKKRTGSTATGWAVYISALGATRRLELNTTAAPITDSGDWNDTAPTSTVFTLGFNQGVNNSASTYVAYLFATLAGVSKVGSYTGNGSTQTIDCGFTGGARFVLIKRTDSTGDWYVYDTARGMTALTDPYWLTNSANAEAATLGSVTTVSTGFALNAAVLAAINASGGSYIFLAIA